MDVFARETNKDVSKLNEIDENDNDSVEGTVYIYQDNTGSSCLMRISLLRFFKTITKIWLMRFYGLFILLMRSLAKNLANAFFG